MSVTILKGNKQNIDVTNYSYSEV